MITPVIIITRKSTPTIMLTELAEKERNVLKPKIDN
jgi:hypothetical protein